MYVRVSYFWTFFTFPVTDSVIYREERPFREHVRLFHKGLFESLISSEQYTRSSSKVQRAHASISLSNLSNVKLTSKKMWNDIIKQWHTKAHLWKDLHWVVKTDAHQVSNEGQREGTRGHVAESKIKHVLQQQQNTEKYQDSLHIHPRSHQLWYNLWCHVCW